MYQGDNFLKSNIDPSKNNDGLINVGSNAATGAPNNQEANDPAHISLNAKVAGGTASIVYAPSSHSGQPDDDTDDVVAAQGGSITSYVYQGSPVKDFKFIIGRNVVSPDNDGLLYEATTDKVGLSYSFGKAAIGYERQKLTYDDKPGFADFDMKADNFAATYAVSDSLTLGVQYSKTESDELAAMVDEKIKAISAGYNLGGASIALSLVETENLGNLSGDDTQGVVITTKFGF